MQDNTGSNASAMADGVKSLVITLSGAGADVEAGRERSSFVSKQLCCVILRKENFRKGPFVTKEHFGIGTF